MKKLITAIVAGAMAIFAHGGSWTDANGVLWYFYTVDNTATITGASYYGATLSVPISVYEGETEYSVVAIGDTAFNVEDDLTVRKIQTVEIPDGVETIGERAFFGGKFTSLMLGENLRSIGNSAFGGCSNLFSVVFRHNVEEIGAEAFKDCTSLRSVYFESYTPYITFNPDVYSVFANTPYLAMLNANDNWANAATLTGKEGSVLACNDIATTEEGEPEDTQYGSLWWKWTAPAGVTAAAFHTVSGLTDFNTVIGVYTGTSLAELTQVAMNDDRVGGMSFASFEVTPGETYYICVATSEGLPENGDFKLCWKASDGFSLVIEDGALVGFIGECPESIAIPNTVTLITESAFDSDYEANISVENLKSVVIPESVATISIYAFYSCVHLSSVTFNNGLLMIDDGAFDYCYALAGTLKLPGTVMDVDGDAFCNIDGPLKILAPSSVKDYLESGKYGGDCPTTLTVEYYDVPVEGHTEVCLRAGVDGYFGTGVPFEDGALGVSTIVDLWSGETAWNDAISRKPMSEYGIFGGFSTDEGVLVWDHNMKYVGGTDYWTSGGKWAYDGAVLYVTAQWVDPSAVFSISFSANGGTGGKTFASVGAGRTLGYYMKQLSPKRDGCTFNGWWTAKTGGRQVTAEDIVLGNATYYAHWKVPSCSIFFHANGGTGGKTFTAAKGAKLGTYMDKVSPKREGCTFDGWWTAKTGGTQVKSTDTVNADATYYAHWIVPTCSVFFHANGGTGGKTFPSVVVGTKLGTYMDKVSPKRDGFDFNGWWTEKKGGAGTQVTATTAATGDATYYAHWKAQTCSLFFHANGGTGGKTFTVPKGSKVSDYTGKVSPKRDGYTFDGWWTARSGGTKLSSTATVSANVTYYAHWK